MKKLHYTEYNDLVHAIKADYGWFRKFIALVKEYYSENGAGGSLHIVLDDGNLEDSHVDWCSGYASGANDEAGSQIGELMRSMTMEQRQKVYENYKLYS